MLESMSYAQENIHHLNNVKLGTGSCSSSACHGNAGQNTHINIMTNEYIIWSKQDAHSKAWKVLKNEDSLIIAKHLGIKDPSSDKQCLNCHSPGMIKDRTGNIQQSNEGVNCESCHGSSENWIKSHTQKNSSHEVNVKNGLIDLVNLESRAKVCLECHLGAKNSAEVNHQLIAAGHPRLTFELDTFTQITPHHWKIDTDYINRKGTYSPTKALLIGQITRQIELIDLYKNFYNKHNKTDYTFTYCYSCHHSLKDDNWKKIKYSSTPGINKFNLSSALITNLIFKNLNKDIHADLSSEISEIYKLDFFNLDPSSLKNLETILKDKAIKHAANLKLSNEQLNTTLKNIIEFGLSDDNFQYETAEQVLMAMSSISVEKGENPNVLYRKLYKCMEHEESFNIFEFKAILKQL